MYRDDTVGRGAPSTPGNRDPSVHLMTGVAFSCELPTSVPKLRIFEGSGGAYGGQVFQNKPACEGISASLDKGLRFATTRIFVDWSANSGRGNSSMEILLCAL